MSHIVFIEEELSLNEVKKLVQQLAANGQIAWTSHAKQRMRERGITIPQIIHCLSKGKIVELPIFSYENGGGYRMSVESIVSGKWLKAVVSLQLSQRLLVITAHY